MTENQAHRSETDSIPGIEPKQPAASVPTYESPAIIHRGKLELRAGSPTGLPDFADPNNPFK